MRSSEADSGVIRFDAFEADLRAGELRKRGRPLKLEAKPFQVLAALLRRPGELVTRDELREELWAADTFVEFDHSLNTAVNKLRSALGDSAREPKFIETLHRRGYRFIGELGGPWASAHGSESGRPEVQRTPGAEPLVSMASAATIATVSAVAGIVFGICLTLVTAPEPAARVVREQTPPPSPPPSFGTILTSIAASRARQQLVWVDRQGRRLEPIGQTHLAIMYPSLSPDERSVSASIGNDVWIQDVDGARALRLSKSRHRDVLPLWSPKGDSILYSTHSSGDRNIYVRNADGSREAARLHDKSLGGGVVVFDWSRDGQYVVFRQESFKTQADIGYLKRNRTGGYDQFSFLATRAGEGEPKLSPDNRFIAYCSNESGRREVYVSTFPAGDQTLRVSQGGGTQPRWSRDGRELFYVKGDALMAASVGTSATLGVGSSAELFRHKGLKCEWPSQQYDVSRDGRRFLVVERVPPVQADAAVPLLRVPIG
jgi:DNA-binding winged helix-turn-helix (wHTH) protein